MFIGDNRLIQLIAVAGLSFALSIGPYSASRADDAAAPAAAGEGRREGGGARHDQGS